MNGLVHGREDAMRERKGSKLARSETVSVRLDPKLRYLAELAARKQRRTLSSFIEWAIEDALDRVYLDGQTSIRDAAKGLWDVDEGDRFVKLALRYPDMLTHTEQVLWKLIRENGYLWRGSFAGPEAKWTWRVREEGIILDRLRDWWKNFTEVAAGNLDRDALPKWKEQGEPLPPEEDDIPF